MRPLLVFVGPSGVGKSTVARRLQASRHIALLPTWTTRPQRSDELVDVAEHKFVTDAEMNSGLASGAILECMSLFNLPYRYGLPRLEVAKAGPVTVLMARAHLLGQLRRHTEDFIVYQFEANPEVARMRLETRAQDGVEIGSRLELFSREIELGRAAAKRVFCNDGSPYVLARKVVEAFQEDYP